MIDPHPQTDLIAAVKRGERISTQFSMFSMANPQECARHLQCDGGLGRI